MAVVMTDEKSELTTVRLVAIERGFLSGRMVEPGTRFDFDASRKVPKWAAKEADAKPPKDKPKAGDLKPKDTQAAVKAKMAAFAGEQA